MVHVCFRKPRARAIGSRDGNENDLIGKEEFRNDFDLVLSLEEKGLFCDLKKILIAFYKSQGHCL